MDGELDLLELRNALEHLLEQARVLDRRRVADGVGQVDDRGAGPDGGGAHLGEEAAIGARRVLGRELDLVRAGRGVLDRPGDALQHLVGLEAELALHVDRARRDEDVQARARRVAQRLDRGVDVIRGRARKGRDGDVAHGGCGSRDALEVSGRRRREAGFDHVDTQPLESPRDLGLLVGPQCNARRLLAVSQGRIENRDPAHSVRSFRASALRTHWSVFGGRMRH